jgi:glycosyltransferase involved in cell wall biosynthesis
LRKIVYIDNFLVQHGHTPTIGEYLTALLVQEGYNLVKVGTAKNKPARLLEMLKAIYSHRRNSVVLLTTYSTSAFYFAWLCGRLCALLGVPYIPCLHGGNLPQRIHNWPKLSRQLFGNSYMNVAVSGYLEKSMHEHGWKVTTIPNNIHIGVYPFQWREACSARLLWVRSFHEIYNPQMALHLLKALLKVYPDAKLAMVGPDKDGSLAACKTLAAELDITEHIEFTGLMTREQWVALSREYDIFINTTHFDNLPVSVIEAMALGMVVVSTNPGGLPYLIKKNENGLLVNKADVHAMEQAVLQVCNNAPIAASLSARARTTAETYDWHKVKLQWHALLDSMD